MYEIYEVRIVPCFHGVSPGNLSIFRNGAQVFQTETDRDFNIMQGLEIALNGLRKKIIAIQHIPSSFLNTGYEKFWVITGE